MEIDTYVKALDIICEENGLKPSHDMILDCAVRCFITDKIGAKKENTSNGATEKQISTMKKLGIEAKDGISKKEASDLIGKKIDSFK